LKKTIFVVDDSDTGLSKAVEVFANVAEKFKTVKEESATRGD